MNKVCVLTLTFCAVVAFTRARECYLLINNMKCPYECCGEEGSMRCVDSCNNVDCSSNEDCGDSGCCSNGKCTDDTSDCDSWRQTPYIPCSDECSYGCCNTGLGICETQRFGCSNCSSNEACPSGCCKEGKCEDFDVCETSESDEEPTEYYHEDSSHDSSTTTHVNWKIPVIVIVVVIAVIVKISLLVTWAMRRSHSRVVVVQRAMAPTSVVQASRHHASDTVPFLSQDEEQIKHLQTATPPTATV